MKLVLRGIIFTSLIILYRRDVSLSHNFLTTFPLALCGLKHLNVLDLTYNQITQIPPEIKGLEAIELIMNHNQVHHVAREIGQCPRLKTLRLEENCLSIDKVPTSLFTDR